MIQPTFENINAFLHFGWLPRTDIAPPFPEEWIPQSATRNHPSSKEAANILREAVSVQLSKHSEVVVPLSGGFDSRAMLAILYELGKNITAVSLGVPGTYDYEIGKSVAKAFNIKHEAINVNEIPLSTNELVDYVKQTGDWANAIEVFYNIYIAKIHSDKPIVSGFLGDFLAGTYANKRYVDWNDAKDKFCTDNKISWFTVLTSPEYSAISSMPAKKYESALTDYEYLVYRTRHTCSMRPTAFKNSLGYVTPFRDKRWIEYILSCSVNHRQDQSFYHQMLIENWPDFFSLPSKNYKGAAINSSEYIKYIYRLKSRILSKINRTFPSAYRTLAGIDKMVNYTDFHHQMIVNPNFRNIVIENTNDLKQRKSTPWLDLETLCKPLYKQKITYHEGVILLVLTNLEINLKASSN